MANLNPHDIRPAVFEFSILMSSAMRSIYQGRLYDKHWGKEFAWKEADRALESVEKLQVENLPDIKGMSKSELLLLGFVPWDTTQSSFIIPSHLRKVAIRDGLMEESTDTDTRMGCFFVFVSPKE